MKITFILIFCLSFYSGWSQTVKPILKKYPKEIQKIIHNENGNFRGSYFGDDKTLIKSREKILLQSETDTTLSFTINFDADDFADVLYYLDSTGKARSFAVIFILQDVNAEKNLKTYLIKYFNERFGQYTVVNKEDELWTSSEGYAVEMKDTSDEAGMEIEIVYYKL